MVRDDFVGRQIRRTTRNLLILGIVLVGLVGGVVALEWQPVHNYLFGPFAIGAAELESFHKTPSPTHFYVRVTGENAFDTETQVVQSGQPSKVLGEIVALEVGRQILLVKAPSFSSEQRTFKGTLGEVPFDLKSRMDRAWSKNNPNSPSPFLPCLLDATGIWKTDAILVAGFGALVAGGGLWVLGLALSRVIRPESHPLLAKLATYGDVWDVRGRIDSDLVKEGGGEKFGGLQVTANWVVNAARYRTQVMAIRELLWCYGKVTKHYHNGIPTGTTYTAMIRDGKGQSVEVRGKKATIPQMLESIQRRAPWMVVGHSKELEEIWKHDRSKFVEMVEKRRAAASSGPVAPGA